MMVYLQNGSRGIHTIMLFVVIDILYMGAGSISFLSIFITFISEKVEIRGIALADLPLVSHSEDTLQNIPTVDPPLAAS